MSPELPPLLLPLLLLGSAHSWPAPPARDEILRGLALGHGERAPPCNIDVVHYPFFSKREFDRRYRGRFVTQPDREARATFHDRGRPAPLAWRSLQPTSTRSIWAVIEGMEERLTRWP